MTPPPPHDFPLAPSPSMLPFGSYDSEVVHLLERARENILNPDQPWRFGDWRTCTCGHLFLAATGQLSEEVSPVFGSRIIEDSPYGKAMISVATVLGFSEKASRLAGYQNMAQAAAAFVSDATAAAARVHGLSTYDESEGEDAPSRDAAISVIDEALAEIRKQELAAMKELAAAAAG